MPFRLRHMQHNFELAPGDFLIGRDAQCQLVLDDPLVSRKHAKLVVGEDSVRISDLGSRNGVTVNGERIDEPRVLVHADQIVIGSQEMMIVAYLPQIADGSNRPFARRAGSQTLTAMPAVVVPGRSAATPAVPVVGDTRATPPPPAPGDARPTPPPPEFRGVRATPTPPVAQGAGSSAPPGLGARAVAAPLLSSLADKALGLGRAEEAERILAGVTADVLRGLEQGQDVPAETVDMAGQYGVRLAVATGKGKWVDYVVTVYARAGRPFPAAIIDELHSAIRKIDAVDVRALRAYVAQLHEKSAGHGPAERFLVKRIEGLERLAALR
jgi:predicted component of type VI protein secretion system